MTMSFQLASQPLPTDEPVMNYQASTDVPAKTCVKFDTSNLMGTAGDGVGVLATAANTDFPYGIMIQDAPVGGSAGLVRTQGRAVAVCDATVTAGNLLMAGAVTAGRVTPQTAGKPTIGIALTSGAAGDDVLVEIIRANNA